MNSDSALYFIYNCDIFYAIIAIEKYLYFSHQWLFDKLLRIEMSKTPIKCKPQTKQKNRNEVVSKKENTKTNLAAKTTKPSKKYSKKIKRNVLRILNSEQKLRT